MCEILAVRWATPTRFQELVPWAEKVEYYGIASFGWGVAWLDHGQVKRHRYEGRLSEDPSGVKQLANVVSTHFLVHFRRPNRLSTIQMADTQPFLAEKGRFAFCHNGYLERDVAADIDAYDRRRAGLRPYTKQRDPETWGEASFYGWSEDKARQYAEPQRADFGAFVRTKGFCLD